MTVVDHAAAAHHHGERGVAADEGEASPALGVALELRAASGYEKKLLGRGHVIARSAGRGARVRELVLAAAQQAGGQAIIDPALLAEVTALVEWPVAIAGRFEQRFLAEPAATRES